MSRRIDLTGKQYGKLTVLEFFDMSHWWVKCECGNIAVKYGEYLRNGDTKSCGCMKYSGVKTHGYSNTITYNSYRCMKSRCLGSKHKNYIHYGNKGIKVCDRWLNSFDDFLEDMGECPKGYSLDRVNPLGNYEPSNCKWIPKKEQCRKMRSNKINHQSAAIIKDLYSQGVSKFEMAHILNCSDGTIYQCATNRTWGDVEPREGSTLDDLRVFSS